MSNANDERGGMSANDFDWVKEVDDAILTNEEAACISDYIEAHMLLRAWLSNSRPQPILA